MIKWRCCPELVQFYGFRSVKVLLDTPLGSPENCPGAKGGSVQISLSRPVSFFMVKPRFSSSRDQFSPVQSSRPLGFGHVLSDQPAASRLEHSGANPPMLGMFCGGLVFLAASSGFKETSYSLDRKTKTSGSCPMAEYYMTV
ncbi:hypothetical protein Bca52824_074834 [Brassica carinata]|uniref:Uncharacterized protein n=1 Tax=Brassica carinata TaxID=52824 RepID=A0A8X7TUV1_BRACI|nr:hypothetical protein Bca52824_074834 [Brassica carinata]